MDNPNLHEATLKDICDELSNRSLNFVLAANYYDARTEDSQPILSFGVRKQDLTMAIGMLEAAKGYLVDEFGRGVDVQRPGEDDDEEDDEDDEEPPF